MKRSLQEIVELLVFALIALVIGTGLLWLVGWVLGLVGALFKIIAGFIWLLLKYIIPIAIIAAAVYFLVRLAQNQDRKAERTSADAAPANPQASPPPPPPRAERPLEEETIEEAKADGAKVYDAEPPADPERREVVSDEDVDEPLDEDDRRPS